MKLTKYLFCFDDNGIFTFSYFYKNNVTSENN